MNRQQRIANIQKRIEIIDRELGELESRLRKQNPETRHKTIVQIDKLYTRRDVWESHLAHAECGPMKVYSR